MAEVVVRAQKTAKIFLIIMCRWYKLQNSGISRTIISFSCYPISFSFLFIWNGGKGKKNFSNIFSIHKSVLELQESYGGPNIERTLLSFLHSDEMPIILFGHWPPGLVCECQVISYCSSPSPFVPHCCKWHMCDILGVRGIPLPRFVSLGTEISVELSHPH